VIYDHIIAEDMAGIVRACEDDFVSFSGTKVLITGGSGFVGCYLVESLLAWNQARPSQACTLYVPTRSLARLQDKFPHWLTQVGLHCFEWDGQSLNEVGAVDYVIHAASPVLPSDYLKDVDTSMQAMLCMTKALLDYCRQCDVQKMLYLSSGAVYGTLKEGMVSMPETYWGELAQHDVRACYADTKRACENLLKASGVPIVVARLFSFIGPYMPLNHDYAISDFIHSADRLGYIQLHSDGLAQRTYCYAADLSIMLWKLLAMAKGGDVYNVGAASPVVSILELAQCISKLMHVPLQHQSKIQTKARHTYVPDMSKMTPIYQANTHWVEAVKRTLYSMSIQKKITRLSLNVEVQ